VTPIRSEQVLNNKFATAYVYGEEISKALVANMTTEPIQIRKGTQIAEFHIRDEKHWDFKSSYDSDQNNNNNKEHQNMPMTDQQRGAMDAPQRTFADSEAQLSVGNFPTEGDQRGVCVCAKEKGRGGTQLNASEFSQSNLSEHMQSNLSKSTQLNLSESSQSNLSKPIFSQPIPLSESIQSKISEQSNQVCSPLAPDRADGVFICEMCAGVGVSVCGRILCELRAGVGVYKRSCVWGINRISGRSG